MEEANVILQALGRIEGTVNEIRDQAREHRDDDKRRFTELHVKVDGNKADVNEKIAEIAQDVNKAKGATTLIKWLLGGGALSIATLVYALASGKLGTH